MTSPTDHVLGLFELRCRVRRQVAEVLCLLPEESRHREAARRLSERYLNSVTSADGLWEVGRSAQDLLGRVRSERHERAGVLRA